MPVPELDDDARRRALDKAAESRRRRAEVKRQLKSGERSLGDVLACADTDEVVGKTKVHDVLASLPRVGRVRAEQLMERAGIAPSRRLRGLGARQRARLLAELDDQR